MDEREFLAAKFEQYRPHLRAVAHRLLGSPSEAEDAVQETWLRLSRSGVDDVENLGGWLTTIVGRVSLNMLRSRVRRGERPLDAYVPEQADGVTPEQEVVLADSVGLALLVVLEALTPAERLAFVLHDLFALSFEEIAPIVGRTPAASRQLASRARRRVRGAEPTTDLDGRREVVDAFLSAARGGDLDELVALLDPDITHTSAAGVCRGARDVAEGAIAFAKRMELTRPALVDGDVGAVATVGGEVVSVALFTIARGRIVVMETSGDPDRLARFDITLLEG